MADNKTPKHGALFNFEFSRAGLGGIDPDFSAYGETLEDAAEKIAEAVPSRVTAEDLLDHNLFNVRAFEVLTACQAALVSRETESEAGR